MAVQDTAVTEADADRGRATAVAAGKRLLIDGRLVERKTLAAVAG